MRLSRRALIILLLPATLFYTVFFIIPFFISFGVSLGIFLPSDVQISRGELITLRYYEQVFDQIFLRVFLRSLALASATTALCLLIAYPMAYYIAVKAVRYRNFLLLLVIMPLWVTFLLRAYALLTLLGPEGFVNGVLLSLGLIQQPLFLIYNETSVLIGMVYSYLPLAILPLYSTLVRLDKTVIEASRVLGAGPLKTFFKVTLPISRPGVFAAVLLTFIPAAGEFIVPSFLGGPNEVYVGTLIYNAFLAARNWNWGAAMSIVYISVVLLGVVLYLRLVGEELRV
jgi:spermidine/putrescine transport system permease protein